MFAKLLKYDMKSLRRVGVTILLVILAAAIIGSACVALLVTSDIIHGDAPESGIAAVLQGLTYMAIFFVMMMVVFALIGAATVMSVFIYVNFYKNLITDEGYLTFTLPVRSKDIIFSKLVSAIIWSVSTTVAVVAAIIAMVCVGMLAAGENPLQVFAAIGDLFAFLGEAFDISGASDTLGVVVMVIFIVLIMIASLITSNLLYFLAIFLGSVIVKKNKVLAAIGLVTAFNFAYSIVYNMINTVVTLICGAGTYTSSYLLAFNIGLALQLVFIAGMGVLFYYLLKYLMNHKVNLA